MLRKRTARHSKAQNANFVFRKYWVHLIHHCVRIFIFGYHAEIKYKNVLFLFQSYFSCDGVPWWYPKFYYKKYDILAFKWRVLSIFSIPGSKVIPKNKRTLVKCPGLYHFISFVSVWLSVKEQIVATSTKTRKSDNSIFKTLKILCRKKRRAIALALEKILDKNLGRNGSGMSWNVWTYFSNKTLIRYPHCAFDDSNGALFLHHFLFRWGWAMKYYFLHFLIRSILAFIALI